MTDAELTQMPDPYLDNIDRTMLEREIRGAIYVAQMHVRSAQKNGNRAAIKSTRQGLAALYWRARAESIAPYRRAPERREPTMADWQLMQDEPADAQRKGW
jgi:hypothetical protein